MPQWPCRTLCFAWAEFEVMVTFFGNNVAKQGLKDEPSLAEWTTKPIVASGDKRVL